MSTENEYRHAKFAILPHAGQGALRRDVASLEPWVYFKADEIVRLSDFAMEEMGAEIVPVPADRAGLIGHINDLDGVIRKRNEELKAARGEIAELKAALDVSKMTRVLTPPPREHKDRLTKAVRVFFDMPSEYYHQKRQAMEEAIAIYLEPLEPTQEELDIQRIKEVLSSFAIADEHTGERDDFLLAQRMYDQGMRVEEKG